MLQIHELSPYFSAPNDVTRAIYNHILEVLQHHFCAMGWAERVSSILILGQRIGFRGRILWTRANQSKGSACHRMSTCAVCTLSVILLPLSCMWWQADIRVKAPWSRVEQMSLRSLSFQGGVIQRPVSLRLSLSLCLFTFSSYTSSRLWKVDVFSFANTLFLAIFLYHLFCLRTRPLLAFFFRHFILRSVFAQ